METYAIDLYANFKCIEADCPQSCCVGWDIVIDDATLKTYSDKKDTLGLICRSLSQKKENYTCVRTISGRCPYYGFDHLCRLQKKSFDNLMPQVCKDYPRRVLQFGNRRELTLELSCYEAAFLFVYKPQIHEFIILSDNTPVFWELANDDANFFNFLLNDREMIIDRIKEWSKDLSAPGFTLMEKSILQHAYQIHSKLVKGIVPDNSTMSNISLNNASDNVATGNIADDDITFSDNIFASLFSQNYCPFPISFLNELIYDRFLDRQRQNHNKNLYKYASHYEKHFSKLYEVEADSVFSQKMDALLEERPDLLNIFTSYFAYLLLQTYPQAYENYYLLGPVLLALYSTEFFMLFTLTEHLSGNPLKASDLAIILASLERGLRHSSDLNIELLDNMRRLINPTGQ